MADWKSDNWGIASLALAAFATGFAVLSGGAFLSIASGAALAGAVAAVSAQQKAIGVAGLLWCFLALAFVFFVSQNSDPVSPLL